VAAGKSKIALPTSGAAAVAFSRSTPKWIFVQPSIEQMRSRAKTVKLTGERAPVGQENFHALFD
jgi:hypothetical protein